MQKLINKYLPAIIANLLVIAGFYFLYSQILQINNGKFVYVLDDSYIHLAIAKNWALYDVFGITKHSFTSSSSSPLWSLLLYIIFKISSVNEFIPLILNIIFVCFSVFLSNSFLYQNIKNQWIRLSILIILLVFSAIIPVAFTGLEHSLHLTLFLLYLFALKNYFLNDNFKNIVHLSIISMLVVSSRYESIFLIFIVFLYFAFTKRKLIAVIPFAFSLIGPTILGIISLANHWSFLPSSLLLKGNYQFTGIESLFKVYIYRIILKFAENSDVLSVVLMLGISLFLLLRTIKNRETKIITFLDLLSILLHLQFAQTGWFFRYELYFIFIGLIIIFDNFAKIINDNDLEFDFKQKILIFFIAIILFSPLLNRGLESFRKVKIASNEIYLQQFQTAKFIKQFYTKKSIILNDVGFPSFYSDFHLTDLWGLCDRDVFYLKKERNLNTKTMETLFEKRKSEIAIIYDSWYINDAKFPENWRKVADFTIPSNYIVGDNVITFMAKDSLEMSKLRANIEIFSKNLPNQIEIKLY